MGFQLLRGGFEGQVANEHARAFLGGRGGGGLSHDFGYAQHKRTQHRRWQHATKAEHKGVLSAVFSWALAGAAAAGAAAEAEVKTKHEREIDATGEIAGRRA